MEEAKILMPLIHDHVVRCHTAFIFPRQGGRFYMLLELIEGGDLAERIKTKARSGKCWNKSKILRYGYYQPRKIF